MKRLILMYFLLLFFANLMVAQTYQLDSLFYADGTAQKRLQSKQKLEQEYIAKLYNKNIDSITSSQ